MQCLTMLIAFQKANNLRRANIDELLDRHDCMNFIVMEYMKGNDLESRMEKEKVFRWSAAKDVILQVCPGLGALHSQGMAHHDVKPSNIFITGDNVVKVFDFDFSVFTLFETQDSGKTTTGKLFGTPQYLAPEKIFDKSDHRVDVFSVGVILYEMLTGTLPFDGENHVDTLHAVMHLDPLMPSMIRTGISPQMDATVMRALEKNPAALSQSLAKQFNVPAFDFDLGATKASHVGDSEANIRAVMKMLRSIGGRSVYFVATCNGLAELKPELKRRFTDGVWYVDLPNAAEREASGGSTSPSTSGRTR